MFSPSLFPPCHFLSPSFPSSSYLSWCPFPPPPCVSPCPHLHMPSSSLPVLVLYSPIPPSLLPSLLTQVNRITKSASLNSGLCQGMALNLRTLSHSDSYTWAQQNHSPNLTCTSRSLQRGGVSGSFSSVTNTYLESQHARDQAELTHSVSEVIIHPEGFGIGETFQL